MASVKGNHILHYLLYILCRFSQALQLESDLSEALEHKDYTSATALYTEAKLEADRVLADQTAVK